MNRLTKGQALVGSLNVGGTLTADNISTVTAVMTVGAETGGNTINVAIQLNDGTGTALARRCALPWYLSSDANGDAIAAATSSGIAIGTDGLLLEWTANVSGMVISEADGDIDVSLVEASTGTWYLVLVLPGGNLSVSGAITFA